MSAPVAKDSPVQSATVPAGDARATVPVYAATRQGSFLYNLIWMGIGTVVSMFTSLLIARYLWRVLGADQYGVVTLVTSSNQYLLLLGGVLNTVAGRYFIKSTHDGNEPRVFSTILLGNIAICVALVTLVIPFSSLIAHWLAVPPSLEAIFRPTLWMTAAALAVTQQGTTRGVIAYSLNRLDIQSKANSLSSIVRAGFILAAFALLSARVEYVGAAMLVSAFASLAVFRRHARHARPQLHASTHLFDGGLIRQMLADSVWVLLTQLGTLLFLRLDVFLVGRFFGMGAVGKYGAIAALLLPLQSLTPAIGVLFGPTITQLAVQRRYEELAVYCSTATKMLGFILAAATALMCANPRMLMGVWLGAEYATNESAILLIVQAAPLCLTFSVLPLLNLQVAANRMVLPSTATWVLAGVNIALTLLLLRLTDLGIVAIPLSIAVSLILKNTVITPIHCARILGQPWHRLLWPLVATAVMFTACVAAQLPWAWFGSGSGLGVWLVQGGVVILVSLGTGYLLLNTKEKQQIAALQHAIRERRFARK